MFCYGRWPKPCMDACWQINKCCINKCTCYTHMHVQIFTWGSVRLDTHGFRREVPVSNTPGNKTPRACTRRRYGSCRIALDMRRTPHLPLHALLSSSGVSSFWTFAQIGGVGAGPNRSMACHQPMTPESVHCPQDLAVPEQHWQLCWSRLAMSETQEDSQALVPFRMQLPARNGASSKINLDARKISMRYPPMRFLVHIHVCVLRCNWRSLHRPRGPEGALIAHRTPGKRDRVEFTHSTRISQDPVYKQGVVHTITLGMYPPCTHPASHVCEPQNHKNRPEISSNNRVKISIFGTKSAFSFRPPDHFQTPDAAGRKVHVGVCMFACTCVCVCIYIYI